MGGIRRGVHAYSLEFKLGRPSHVGVRREGADDATPNGFGVHCEQDGGDDEEATKSW